MSKKTFRRFLREVVFSSGHIKRAKSFVKSLWKFNITKAILELFAWVLGGVAFVELTGLSEWIWCLFIAFGFLRYWYWAWKDLTRNER